jgi:regulatory protein
VVIENIKRKSVSDVLITFDNGEKFTLAYELLMKSGLKTGQELSEAQLHSLKESSDLFIIKRQAFHFLNRRMHSAAELRLKLIRKGLKVNLIDQVIKSLLDTGYINDREYAEAFIEEKKRGGWGNKLISQALIKRGVQKEFIDELINEGGDQNSRIRALDLLRKKYKMRLPDELPPLKNKMFAYLISKGYDYEEAGSAVREYLASRLSNPIPE